MPEVQKRQRVRIGYQPTMQSLSAGERGLKCAEALQDEERRRHHGRVPAMRVHLEGVRKSRDCKGNFLLRNPGFSYVCLILLPIGSVQFLLRRDGRLAISKSPYQAAAIRFCCSECQEM